jgi:hypothetical protein
VKGTFKIPCLQLAEAMTLLRFIRKVSGSNISQVLTKVYDIFYEILYTNAGVEATWKWARTAKHPPLLNQMNSIDIHSYKRLRWSRGSVLVFSTQVRGFKPGRSRRIF